MKQSQRTSIEEVKQVAERLTRARLAEVDSEGEPVFTPSYPNGYRHEVHPELDVPQEEPKDNLAKAREAKAAKAAEAKAQESNDSEKGGE